MVENITTTGGGERPFIPSGGRVIAPGSGADRDRLERYVADTYAAAYGARVTHFLPTLLGIELPPRDIAGVIGVKPGALPGPLFLEAYLDEPAERALSRALGRFVSRASLAEIGNLSSDRPGGGRLLISAMCGHLGEIGADYAVFTGTRALRNCFARVGVEVVDLGPADGTRLGMAMADWGSYYATAPRVAATWVPAVRHAVAADAAKRARVGRAS